MADREAAAAAPRGAVPRRAVAGGLPPPRLARPRAPRPASRAALVAAVAARPFAFLAVSALGLVLQFAGLLAIRVLGSVTMKLLGIARSAALVLFEVLRGNEPASLRMIVGYSISLGAFAVYSRLKMKEKQR